MTINEFKEKIGWSEIEVTISPKLYLLSLINNNHCQVYLYFHNDNYYHTISHKFISQDSDNETWKNYFKAEKSIDLIKEFSKPDLIEIFNKISRENQNQ